MRFSTWFRTVASRSTWWQPHDVFNVNWPRHVCCDVSKAASDLGFHAAIDVREGTRRSLKWMAESGKIKLPADVDLNDGSNPNANVGKR